MTLYLLDTNHASPLIGGDIVLDRKVRAVGGNVALCRPSIGELWHGFYSGDRKEKRQRQILHILKAFPVFEYDAAAAEEFGRIMAEQQRKGEIIPPIDAQIAAITRIHSLTVLTADKHFGYVDGITVQNWLA